MLRLITRRKWYVALLGGALVALAPSPALAASWKESATLTARPRAQDHLGFGSSVAVSGSTIVIGAPSRTVNQTIAQGAAYVFTKTASGWHQTAEWVRPGVANGRYGFGTSVAVSRSTVAVSSPYRGNGTVYVFTKTASGWHQTAVLTDSTGGESFGLGGGTVAVSGDTVVVGAFYAAGGAGRVYVFTKTASGWHQTAELAGNGTGPGSNTCGDCFGSSVAVSGNTVVVGGNARAYMFTKTASGWQQTTTQVVGPNSVAVSGNTVVVGAYELAGQAGRAYVFTKADGGWHQTAELVGSGTAAGDFFGSSVAVSGGTAVVAAEGIDRAYMFTKADGGWHQTGGASFERSVSSGSSFGTSVAVSGNTAVVGVPDVGRAYVFQEQAFLHPARPVTPPQPRLQAVGLVLPPGAAGSSASLASVSCAAARICTAIGFYNGSLMEAVEVDGGWRRAQQVRLQLSPPLKGLAFSTPALLSLSCTSENNCVLVGGSAPAVVAVAEVRGVWGSVHVFGRLGRGATVGPVSLNSVSCPSPGNCVAVGSYFDYSENWPMEVTQTNGVWGRVYTPYQPPDAGPNRGQTGLRSVSCTSPGNCVAIGDYVNTAGLTEPMEVTEASGFWERAQRLALPPNASTAKDPIAGPYSVSCTSPGNCVAVGGYSDTTGDNWPTEVMEVNGTWEQIHAVAAPINAKPVRAGVALNGVSCLSPGNCVAVGNYVTTNGRNQAMEAAEANGTWTRANEVRPPKANAGLTTLNAVSCTGWNCTAVGYYTDISGAELPMELTFRP